MKLSSFCFENYKIYFLKEKYVQHNSLIIHGEIKLKNILSLLLKSRNILRNNKSIAKYFNKGSEFYINILINKYYKAVMLITLAHYQN